MYIMLIVFMGGENMNQDFPRIITLLRKERNISQKKAAYELGVSQALLSHYEKGIRECGLEFLVKAADYYGVSCDYLLGRSPEPTGSQINYTDIPEHDSNEKETVSKGSIMASFNKKLIINSLNILYSLAQKTQSDTLTREISNYLMLAIYKLFRIVFSVNPQNDINFFTIHKIFADNGALSAMAFAEAQATAAAQGILTNGNDSADRNLSPVITASKLQEDYPNYASSILNVIKNSESKIQLIKNAHSK